MDTKTSPSPASALPPFSLVTGQAGTGKTFWAKAWAEADPTAVLCATTGIAAVNLGEGTTINALLGYFDTASLQDLYVTGQLTGILRRLRKAKVIHYLLDEVSMLDGNQLTFLARAIDEANGEGYILGRDWDDEDEDTEPDPITLTLLGDFCQLPPVKAPFAFESPEWEKFAPHVMELTEIRRQDDREFVEALQAVRRGDADRALEYFAPRMVDQTDMGFDGPTVLAKNDQVDRFNQLRVDQLPGEYQPFDARRWGKQRPEWKVIPETLNLKPHSLVMVLANFRDELDPQGRRFVYVNGDLGEFLGKDGGVAKVKLQRTGQVVHVLPVTRDVTIPLEPGRRKALKDAGTPELITKDGKKEIVGQITYLPLRVAYATTCHKSQGLTLDQVQVNIRDPFFSSPGMLYVALSRARTSEGLRLVGNPLMFRARCKVNPKLGEWL